MAHGPICREVGMIRDHPRLDRADASSPGQSQSHLSDTALARCCAGMNGNASHGEL